MRRTGRLALALALMAAGLPAAACGSVPAAPRPTPAPGLAGTRWVLISLGPPSAQRPAVAGVEATLEFRPDGRAGGSGGCNDYQARATLDGQSVSFGSVGSTKKLCDGAGVMAQEQAFFRALETATAWRIEGTRLIVDYDGGQGALTLAALPGGS